jgi:molybdate transport system permease protein
VTGRRRAGVEPLPRWAYLPAAVALLFLCLPLVGILLRTPWSTLGDELFSRTTGEALRLSLVCATAATGISLVLGVPLAILLARSSFRGRGVVRALVTVPLVLPPVVGGVALFLAFGRRGLLGPWLESWFGISLPFTTFGVIIAETFVAMPLLIVTVEGAVRGVDTRYAEVTGTLGATPGTTLWRVTLPLARPGLVAGAVLCWARALGEFGATITFAGSFPGRTQTMPLAVYEALDHTPSGAIALSLLLLTASVAVLVLLRDRWIGRSG